MTMDDVGGDNAGGGGDVGGGSVLFYHAQTSLQGNGGLPAKTTRRQSLLSVAWTDIDTGVEKIMWREIDKVSRVVFPGLFLVFVVLYWPILLMKSNYDKRIS